MDHLALADIIGFLAGALTTAAFVPQVAHSWRTRDLAGISLKMYGLFTAGVALWLAYGIAIGSWPIIIFNVITLVLSGSVFALKVKHG